jgi:hypothetical protein
VFILENIIKIKRDVFFRIQKTNNNMLPLPPYLYKQKRKYSFIVHNKNINLQKTNGRNHKPTDAFKTNKQNIYLTDLL